MGFFYFLSRPSRDHSFRNHPSLVNCFTFRCHEKHRVLSMQNTFRKPVGEALPAYFSFTVFRGTVEDWMRGGRPELSPSLASFCPSPPTWPLTCQPRICRPKSLPLNHAVSSCCARSAQKSCWSSFPDAFALPSHQESLCICSRPRLPQMASDVLSHREEEGTPCGKMHSQEPWLAAMPHPPWVPYC